MKYSYKQHLTANYISYWRERHRRIQVSFIFLSLFPFKFFLLPKSRSSFSIWRHVSIKSITKKMGHTRKTSAIKRGTISKNSIQLTSLQHPKIRTQEANRAKSCGMPTAPCRPRSLRCISPVIRDQFRRGEFHRRPTDVAGVAWEHSIAGRYAVNTVL